MKRFIITLAFLLIAASVSAQPRLAPPKVTTLTGLRGNQGDIVNLVGTGDYLCSVTTCTTANDWKIIAAGTVSTVTCAQYGVAFAATADTLGCDADLTFNGTTSTLLVGGSPGTDARLITGTNVNLTIQPATDPTGSDNPGTLELAGGDATNAFITGADVTLRGGNAILGGADADDGGDVIIEGGGSEGVGRHAGNINLTAGTDHQGTAGNVNLTGGEGNGTYGGVIIQQGNGDSVITVLTAGIEFTGTATFNSAVQLADGLPIRTDSTDAHTMLLQAYDNDTGPGYVTFATFTNGNAPSLVIAPPAGGATVSVTGNFVSTGSGLTVANVGADSCGTTAATVAGNYNAFNVTVGATSGTQCRVALPLTAANRWVCTAGNDTTAALVRAKYVDTTHVDLLGSFTAGDVLNVLCLPR